MLRSETSSSIKLSPQDIYRCSSLHCGASDYALQRNEQLHTLKLSQDIGVLGFAAELLIMLQSKTSSSVH